MKKYIQLLILLFFFCTQAVCHDSLPQKHTTQPKKKLIKILSIDGGGIRGIIPALILKALESKLKKKRHLAECFNVMSGTSTGGIIVLLLNTPGANNEPKFRAENIVNFYQNFGPKVFYQSAWRRIVTFNGWFGEKYSTENLEESLQEYFGDTRLRHSISSLIIPAYDISQDDIIFFKTEKAQLDLARDFYFKDIARATSAAPTYFYPASIKDINQQKSYDLVDGGVAINNPTISACVHAIKLFGKDNDFLVISLGTGTNYGAPQGKLSYGGEKEIKSGGKLDWAASIVPIMMYAANDAVDYQMNELFTSDGSVKKYFRFQPILSSEHVEMDNTDPDNIKALEAYAEDIIKTHDQELSYIASVIDN
jgi:patatin-like phospholipase/acyl hydrolase